MTVLLPDLGPIRAKKPVSFSRQEIFEFVVHATWYASRLYTRAHLVQPILLAVFSYSKTIGVSHQSFAAEKMFFFIHVQYNVGYSIDVNKTVICSVLNLYHHVELYSTP